MNIRIIVLNIICGLWSMSMSTGIDINFILGLTNILVAVFLVFVECDK